MAMQTGENEQALRKILDMTRFISVTILALHYYYYLYSAFADWQLTSDFTDRLLAGIYHTGLFRTFHNSKFICLAFLAIAMFGIRGRKSETISYRTAACYIATGLFLYFSSYFILLSNWSIPVKAAVYMIITSAGFVLALSGGSLLSRIIRDKLKDDIFNEENETFPQEERLLENEYSVNLPARYKLKGKWRKSYLNFCNIFRGVLVAGTPGAGKSFFVIRHFITQTSFKCYTQFVFDFKYPDLSVIAYNSWLKNKHRYQVTPTFYSINFDDLTRSNRCNPLDPSQMVDITDAAECARTILLGINRQFIQRQGDFFVESPINLITAIIWYLRKYHDGIYCTLPHVIEFLQLDYDSLFTLLNSDTAKECRTLVDPFIKAYQADVMEQLEGQIASAKIALGRLSSPALYYVLTGNDLSLDINNPQAPKILCIGSNPQKSQIYGAVISLFVNRLLKIVNQKNKLKNCLIFDEFPTVFINGISNHIAVARSAKSATILGLQDLSQLRKDYGKDEADVIANLVGNIVSGQVMGDTAKQLSERIGKIMQDRQSLSINSGDTSISKSKQLEYAVPASKISNLSSGQFVGMVADDPGNKIELKAFHCEILNDIPAIQKEEAAYKEVPIIRTSDRAMVDANFQNVRQQVQDIKESEIQRMLADPALEHLVIKKN